MDLNPIFTPVRIRTHFFNSAFIGMEDNNISNDQKIDLFFFLLWWASLLYFSYLFLKKIDLVKIDGMNFAIFLACFISI